MVEGADRNEWGLQWPFDCAFVPFMMDWQRESPFGLTIKRLHPVMLLALCRLIYGMEVDMGPTLISTAQDIEFHLLQKINAPS